MATKTPGTFPGFSQEGIAFLRGLAKHNQREWFAPRKVIYESALLEPLRAFVVELSDRLAHERIPIGGSPQRSIFRIYRDIRFSPDKRPYKTHVSAYLTRDGSRQQPGGIYVHIQPGESFVAAAFHEIDPLLLNQWRRAIVDDPKRFRTMLRAMEKSGLPLRTAEDRDGALKRLPRGFTDAPEDLHGYLRLKSFSVSQDLGDRDVMSPRLVETIVRFAKSALPLLRYGWALSD